MDAKGTHETDTINYSCISWKVLNLPVQESFIRLQFLCMWYYWKQNQPSNENDKKKTSSVPLRLWWVIFINAKYIILSFLINKFPSGLYSNLFLTQLPCLNTQLLRYCVIAVLTIAVTHHCISGTLHYTVNTTINKAHCILYTAWHTPISTLHW